MAVKIKICGVRTKPIVDLAIAAGADYLGMVFYPPSPRNLSAEEGAELVKLVANRVPSVAVLVNPDDALVDHIVTIVRPDYLQLHGVESPERLAAIKVRSQRPTIKAVPVATAEDVAKASAYGEIADMILFDAKVEGASDLPGGNGVAFDWKLLSDPSVIRPFGVSGGLTPENVGEAIALCAPDLVDVSSGVERTRGLKDPELVRSFIEAAKAASPEEEETETTES